MMASGRAAFHRGLDLRGVANVYLFAVHGGHLVAHKNALEIAAELTEVSDEQYSHGKHEGSMGRARGGEWESGDPTPRTAD